MSDHNCGNPVRVTTRFGDRQRTNCGCGYVISDEPYEPPLVRFGKQEAKIAELTDELADTRRRLAEVEKERDELSKTIENAHHLAMIDWPGSEVPLLGQVESLFSALRNLYADKYTALRNAADGLACAVGAAPHDKSCYWWPKHPRGEPGACTCWKHKALADYSALISEGAGKA